ncbi:phenylalanine--tRNA ligase beta subunit-related protein [Nocardioides sp. S-58]|uniref:Phenylalanine--tRNA ligase beta subunit-related protein n=1 Tax=Nocardioides renjunii TaxID=3095075 RepID=A0ABU5KB97_9ACTN|nr:MULTISPECIES: phenylalanine--tRNA ligase beta subunit-related protein [unclassified Nocardioides]MDZ5662238.1 phenylalanine--tRNA ligase beta subunit-related protein [Nocardioides sp. S-58]WQQ20410.1 phenylalanine--tRNA ligase beta subunit-related protein [Nocardioides sp. S-34]
MTENHPRPADLQAFLAAAQVDPAVVALRPDYRVLLLAVDGMTPGASDDASERMLVRAESVARELLAGTAVEDLPHVTAWREAYRSFGAKPQRTRNSLEALVRRAAAGLPRVNRLTDVYNAISVIHQVPLGGEDLPAYAGPPRLVRATGSEVFDTVAAGADVDENPEPGEVVWRDAVGVTCRRWNWRQCRRTQLTPQTTSAVFILDALAPLSDGALVAAGDELAEHLARLGPRVEVATRLIAPSTSTAPTAPQHRQDHP